MNRLLRKLLSSNTEVLTPGQRSTHTYVIGQPGTGKSRAIESWVMQDVLSGRGVGVIDPHGDLFNNLLARISALPQVTDRVVILDPINPKYTVSFNPLESMRGGSGERVAHFLTDMIVKIWGLDTTSSPRMIWLLTNTFLALSHLGLTLLDLPRFLLDSDYRNGLLPGLKHESVRGYFEYEFPKSPGAIHQWVTPALNKLGGLIFDPDIRLMIAGGSSFNFRNVIDRRLILLVNLPKGIIGEGTSALMGAFIVAHLQKAALARASSRTREPFYLYLDEFQNYTTDNIKDILSESRKYALSLILAHQYLDQLSADMRSAVLNTAGTLVCFRVGYQDANTLVKEVFPSPDYLTAPEKGIRIERLNNFPLVLFEDHRKPLGWDGQAQALTRLLQREFWFRRRGVQTASRQRTLEVPDPVLTPETLSKMAELLDISGLKYGRLKKDLQKELAARNAYSAAHIDRAHPILGQDENDHSIWGA